MLLPPAPDVALAAVLWILDVFGFQGTAQDPFQFDLTFYSFLGFLPLCWRRRAPYVVLAIVIAHGWIALAIPDATSPLFTVIVALYTVGRLRSGPASVSAAAVGSLMALTTALIRETQPGQVGVTSPVVPVTIVVYTTLCWGSWAVGQWAGRTQRKTVALEAERQLTEEAVTDERRRIAAELHDIVSHSVSVMVLQAAGARRIIGQEPERAADALEHIEDVGKQSMEELRRLLGVLRDGQFLEGEDYVGVQPGLDDLEAYLQTVRQSGLEVMVAVEGEPVRLDPSVDRSAYRIVREALTNSAKYAGAGSTAEVRFTWLRGELVIDVSDDGHAPVDDALGTGHGLVGLFERARAVGGRLEAGPADSGGFRVHATLPVAERGGPVTLPTDQSTEETGSS